MLSKAWFSQYLIKQAWEETLVDNRPHKPWSWADTHPIAQMSIPRLNEVSYVLEGSNARNLAFSATHLSSSGMPGRQLSTIISGHNDSHFDYLQHLKLNDKILIKTAEQVFTYKVSAFKIVDSQVKKISVAQKDELILTTCYPFNALVTGGKLRYMVQAIPMI
jgi:sortase A